MDARAIVDAMHDDLARHQRQLGQRSIRLARETMADLRDKLARERLPSWGAASNLAALTMAANAVGVIQRAQEKNLRAGLPAVAAAAHARQVSLLQVLDLKYAGAVRPLRFDSLAWLETQTASQIRIRQFPRSFARYGAAATQQIEETLAKLALTGQPWTAARPQVWAAIRGVVGDRQWMVDRILRTETAAIYNGTALSAMLAEDTPGDPMMKRLVAIFDKVTGWDSVAVHGQIRPVREPFRDPVGRLYMAPPNRPHDREIVIPHRAAWGERVDHLGGPRGEAAESTATPEALPPPPAPAQAKLKPPARVAAAAATVLALAGAVAEARRRRAPEEPSQPRTSLAPLLAELDLARVRLAAARLGEDIQVGVGVRASTLAPGQVLSAAGIEVRVRGVRRTAAGLQVTLAIAGQHVVFEATPATVVPLRRVEPTLLARGPAGDAAFAAVVAALRAMTQAPARSAPSATVR